MSQILFLYSLRGKLVNGMHFFKLKNTHKKLHGRAGQIGAAVSDDMVRLRSLVIFENAITGVYNCILID